MAEAPPANVSSPAETPPETLDSPPPPSISLPAPGRKPLRPVNTITRQAAEERRVKEKVKTEPLPPVPSPPYIRYWSENPNITQQPENLRKWHADLPEWCHKRTIWYVYRDHPILLPVERDEDGVKLDYGFIDKITGEEEFPNIPSLRDKYGAGEYKLILNDDAGGDSKQRRTLATAWVRENWRDFRSHPPTDRRIDDPGKNLDMNDPANKSYIAFLRTQGKLPDQTKEATNMAEASAVQQVTGIMGKVIDKALDKSSDAAGAAAEGIKVVANAAIKGQEMMADAAKRADALRKETQGTPIDPMAMFDRALGIAKELRAAPTTGEGMVSQFMEMFKITLDVQNARIAFAEKVAMEAKEARVAANGSSEPQGLAGAVRQVVELRDALGFGGGADTAWYKDPAALTAVLQGGGMILGNIVALYQTHVRAQETRNGAMNPSTVMPEPMTQAPGNEGANSAAAGALTGTVVDEEEDQMQYVAFLRAITKPFLNHFDLDTDDLKGALFAEWMVEGYGKSTYDNIKAAGPQTLIMALRTFEPIGKEIRGKDQLLNKFVDEFMNYEKIRAEEEADEEKEGEEENATR